MPRDSRAFQDFRTLPIFPASVPGLGYTVKWTPTFFNQTIVTPSGAAIQSAFAAAPIHTFELTYVRLGDPSGPPSGSALQAMLGFYLALGGGNGRFLYFNPDDNTRVGQAIGTGDGVTTAFPIVRTYGAPGYQLTEPIGWCQDLTDPLVSVSPKVYYDGVPQLRVNGYTPDPGGTRNIYIFWDIYNAPVAPGYNLYPDNTTTYVLPPSCPLLVMGPGESSKPPPGVGVAITMDLVFYYRCRFTEDSNTFEKFLDRIWTWQSVKFQSCRPGA